MLLDKLTDCRSSAHILNIRLSNLDIKKNPIDLGRSQASNILFSKVVKLY